MDPCNNFEEDPYVCHDSGEPKGQCINCGWKEWDHSTPEPLIVPYEPVPNTNADLGH